MRLLALMIIVGSGVFGCAAIDKSEPSDQNSVSSGASLNAKIKFAGAESPSFSDIRWGASKEEVRYQLTSNGFSTEPQNKNGDIKFTGKLVGYDAGGWAYFSENKVAAVWVVIVTPNNKAIETYRLMKDALSKRHGAPDKVVKLFKKPYYDGDGYEERAIQTGNAMFGSFWLPGLALNIRKDLTIAILYESKAWEEESKRRKGR